MPPPAGTAPGHNQPPPNASTAMSGSFFFAAPDPAVAPAPREAEIASGTGSPPPPPPPNPTPRGGRPLLPPPPRPRRGPRPQGSGDRLRHRLGHPRRGDQRGLAVAEKRLDVTLLPGRGLGVTPDEVVHPREQAEDLVIGLRVEKGLDGGLDRQVLDARGLDPGALDGIAKGPPELAGAGAEVEQPRSLAGRRVARRATMVTKIVVHPEQGV